MSNIRSKIIKNVDVEDEDEYEEDEEIEVEVIKIGNSDDRKLTFIKMFDEFEYKLKQEFRENREKLKVMKKVCVQEMKVAEKTNRKKIRVSKDMGFAKVDNVPDSLIEFLSLPIKSKMPRTHVTKLIHNEFKQRGLRYEKDERILRADKEVRKLFNLKESVNNSTDAKDKSGLNMFNLQTYIALCYKKQKEIDNNPKILKINTSNI